MFFFYHISGKLIFDTGSGDKRRQINIHDVIKKHNKDFCQALLGMHAFTGCDSTSSFLRKGKMRPYKLLKSSSDWWSIFQEIGASLDISSQLLSSLERFVCSLYGRPTYKSVNRLRHDLVMERFKPASGLLSGMEGADMCLLPPCKDSLTLHIKRANYQTFIWRRALEGFAEIPSPVGNGWERAQNDNLIICWSETNVLPPELNDVLEAENKDLYAEHSDSNNDDIEFDHFVDAMYGSDDEGSEDDD